GVELLLRLGDAGLLVFGLGDGLDDVVGQRVEFVDRRVGHLVLRAGGHEQDQREQETVERGACGHAREVTRPVTRGPSSWQTRAMALRWSKTAVSRRLPGWVALAVALVVGCARDNAVVETRVYPTPAMLDEQCREAIGEPR